MKSFSTPRTNTNIWIIFTILFFVSNLVTACGGDGSDSAPPPQTMSYTGLSTPATFTSENTTTLAGESFQGAINSNNMVPFATLQTDDGGSISTPMALELRTVFADSLSHVINLNEDSQPFTSERSNTESHMMNGSCGGSASYDLTVDADNGVFSGSFSYDGFCSGGISLSGGASFSGRLSSGNGAFDYLSFAFTSLSITADGKSHTANGTLECDFNGGDRLITTDMIVAQPSTGLVCWQNNFTIQLSNNQMEISGRFYHPAHGYIDFETSSPLIMSDSNRFPSSGQIDFSGAAGTEGLPTTAHLIVISATTCQVTADTDGDGTNEFDTGQIPWSQL